jgi:O-antigen biosynthesis protein
VAGEFFHLASDNSGTGPGTDIVEQTVACYCPGTLIQTARGQTKVEQLNVGDKITTMSGASRPIK